MKRMDSRKHLVYNLVHVSNNYNLKFTTNMMILVSPIVNFPFLDSNIPASPAYGVYVSQLIRYSRACSNYLDFVDKGVLLSNKLLGQGYESIKLKSVLKKCYGRHHDLVEHYNVSVSTIMSDLLPKSEI